MDVLIIVTLAVIGVFVVALAAYLVAVAAMLARTRSAATGIARTFERAESPVEPLEDHLRAVNESLVQLRVALQDLAGVPREAGGRIRTRAEVAHREIGARDAERERRRATEHEATDRNGAG